jgi:hypothetical protein
LWKIFLRIFTKIQRSRNYGKASEIFLSLDLVLKAENTVDGVSLDGRYDYSENVLNSDYGLRVAAKLDQIRESGFSDSLNGVYGEFVELFPSAIRLSNCSRDFGKESI